jgi:FdhD protein
VIETAGAQASWEIAVEAPVQISVNGHPFTVMLATPADLDDLARGLLLTEQVICSAAAIDSIRLEHWLGDFQVSVQIAEEAINTERLGARTVLGNSGCGLCGVESLAQLHSRASRRPEAMVDVPDEAVRRAMATLPAHQPLNALTRSVHAAAWCHLDGTILDVREDVGRHNALDKLLGTLALREGEVEPGFIVMSSRCSYELVYKASISRAQLLATISAPTTMALSWSTTLGVPLASVNRRGESYDIVRFPPPIPHPISE